MEKNEIPGPNIFSVKAPQPEVDPVFLQQAQAQRGTHPTAPDCAPMGPIAPPLNPANPTPTTVPPPPDFEKLAQRSAPGSAVSSALTYTWRKP
jgi:hypothetical protein